MPEKKSSTNALEQIRAELAEMEALEGEGPRTVSPEIAAALLDVAEAAQRLRANAGGLAVANSGARQLVPLLYWRQLCDALDAVIPQKSSEGEL